TEAMSQLNSVTQQNASASEELAATATEMSAQSEQLDQMMIFFKLAADSAGAGAGDPVPRRGGGAGFGRRIVGM
ncbi:MAG TPA: chemotaxis protein, partial [Burkholderiaceae bacterium]|nr:chemotaxis protein [Burkholderiaceae bacterium]